MDATPDYDRMPDAERHALLSRLCDMPPEELLRWAAETHGERAAIITSFQDTGCAMIHMADAAGLGLRVVTVDALRLHPETYALIDELERRYGLQVQRFRPEPDRLEQMVRRHGEYLFFDSKAKQEFCCRVRKVEPNERALATVDVWITGLRTNQSDLRLNTPKARIDHAGGRTILKLAPLANWDRRRVRDFCRENEVALSPLYDRGYSSIGCIICSTPVLPGEDARAGRWRWQNEHGEHKECGLHSNGGGI